MRPDALPVRPAASRAELPPRLAHALFGTELRGGERLALSLLGTTVARVAVVTGDRTRLVLDALDGETVGPALRLVGPVGSAPAPAPEPLRSRLVLPDGLLRAWGVPARATLALGGVAVEVAVETGDTAELRAERALWLAAGQPETARWLPGTPVAFEPSAPAEDDRGHEIEGRVVTETDVRQARLRHRQIVLRAGQIVTPGARDLAREWDVFRPDEDVSRG